jgi:hypothetical protein
MVTLKYCRPQDVAAIIFSENVAYDGCKICEDATSKLYKTYVRKDQDCDPAKINIYRYKSTKNSPCPTVPDGNCALTPDSLYAYGNASDCPDDNYQARKGVYSRALQACDKILDTTRATKPSGGELSDIPMTSLCPVPISSFLKCDPTTRKCRYTALGGQNAPADKVAACTNAFDGCLDSEYLADKAVWEKLNANCAAKWEHQNSLNFYVPTVSIAFIVLIIMGMIYTGVNAGATSERPPSSSTGDAVNGDRGLLCTLRGGKFFLVALVLVLFGSGFLVYDAVYSSDNVVVSSEESKPTWYLIVGIIVLALGVVILLVWLGALYFGSCEPSGRSAAVSL